MNVRRKGPPAEAFFLPAETGERFCLFHPPAPSGKPKGAFIYVHPFGEEMNCSRRMAAKQARALADLGYGVLQMDLFGCGDSSGDFADARWNIWKSDLALAQQWIGNRLPGPVTLWGLRLGAMLALDYVRETVFSSSRIVLWHPVLNGEAYLAQFWRLKLAGQMFSEETSLQTKSLRDALSVDEHVEIAGYGLAADMANAIERLRLVNLAHKGLRIDWFEVAPKPGADVAPAVARTADAWTAAGVDVHLHLLQVAPFWSSPEMGVSQALLDASTRLFAEDSE